MVRDVKDKYVSIKDYLCVSTNFDKRIKSLENLSKAPKKSAKVKTVNYVSAKAFDTTCDDFFKRINALEKGKTNSSVYVSAKAFDKALIDIESRLLNIESSVKDAGVKELKALSLRLDKIESLSKNKVSVSAWNKSMEDFESRVNNLFTREFESAIKELNIKLDNSTSLINDLMIHFNEKVSISAWEKSCVDLEVLSSEFSSLKGVVDEVRNKFLKMESDFKKSQVNEKEIKDWLKSL